jgi:tetratricopeptide (TPR) repeat protein
MEKTREQEKILRMLRKRERDALPHGSPAVRPTVEVITKPSPVETDTPPDQNLINTRTELESARRQYQEELARRNSLESWCATLSREKDELAQRLNAQVAELENLRLALLTDETGEGPAVPEPGEETGEEGDVKKNLLQKLHELTENAEQQAEERERMAAELETEQVQRADAERKLGEFREEWEKRVNGLVAEMNSLQETRVALLQQFNELVNLLDTEREKNKNLGNEIANLNATIGQHDTDVQALRARLDDAAAAAALEKTARLDAENRHVGILADKEKELQALRAENAGFQRELDGLRARLAATYDEPPVAAETAGTGQDNVPEYGVGVDGLVMAVPARQTTGGKKAVSRDGLQWSSGPASRRRDQRESDRALEQYRDAEKTARKERDKKALHKALGGQALIHRDRGELDRAMKLHKEEERICRDIGDRDGLQRSLGNQAVIYRELGETERAMKLHREKERICRDIGNVKGIVISLVNQAGILVHEEHNTGAAIPLLDDAYQIAVSAGSDALAKRVKGYLDKVQSMTSGAR